MLIADEGWNQLTPGSGFKVARPGMQSANSQVKFLLPFPLRGRYPKLRLRLGKFLVVHGNDHKMVWSRVWIPFLKFSHDLDTYQQLRQQPPGTAGETSYLLTVHRLELQMLVGCWPCCGNEIKWISVSLMESHVIVLMWGSKMTEVLDHQTYNRHLGIVAGLSLLVKTQFFLVEWQLQSGYQCRRRIKLAARAQGLNIVTLNLNNMAVKY